MIDLFYWPTPNGKKISIALEEMELPYRVVPVNISRGDQFKPDFLRISPNNRMPAITDDDPPGGGEPISVFESGAILLYLGDKTGRFLPKDVRGRAAVTEWLMWQMGGLGPMAGQFYHFTNYAPEKVPYAIDRYTREVDRLMGVLDRRLAERPYLAGEYSIADMASYPWIPVKLLSSFDHVRDWHERVSARPAVKRGMEAGQELRSAPPDDEARKILFGQTSATVKERVDPK